MFLLTLLHQDEFPIRVAEAPTTYGSSLRRALWRLADALVASPAADTPPVLDDPALLAFCGLPADAEVPAGATAPQDDWLPREVARVLVALRAAMAVPEDRTDRAVLLRVIRRQARLRVEPGWIDVEYDLDDVDVEVRAAGLDLDPGFLPWLGAVVRFRYV